VIDQDAADVELARLEAERLLLDELLERIDELHLDLDRRRHRRVAQRPLQLKDLLGA
jgi:hypothetical protein